MASWPPREGTSFAGWQVRRSRSSGRLYFFSASTNSSVWLDARLPFGWARDAKKDGSSEFVGLLSGARSLQVPTERDKPAEKRQRPTDDRPAASKRGKPGADARGATPTASLPAGSPSAASSVGSAGAAGTTAAAVPDVKETALPHVRADWETSTFPTERPRDVSRALEASSAASTGAPEAFFGPEHQLVLAQLIDAAAATARKRGTGRVTVLDLGAGLGAATRFAVDSVRKHGLLPTVFAVDVWHAPYAGTLVGAHGNRQLSKAIWALADVDAPPPTTTTSSSSSSSSAASAPAQQAPRRLRAGPTFFHAFCRETWALREDVVPLRALLPRALWKLRGDGVEPDVVYVDADLDHHRVRRLLRAVIELFPGAAICGGGWALSKGVQMAVADITRAIRLAKQAQAAAAAGGGDGAALSVAIVPADAAARSNASSSSSSSAAAAAAAAGVSPASTAAADWASHPCPHLPAQLHVERGRAWTIAGGLIRATRNREGTAPSLAASRVAAEDVEEAVSADAWLGKVVQIINASDDGAAVAALCRGHGRPRSAAVAGEGNTAAGPLPGEDAATVWIDNVQHGAKRQLTALMWAAKSGRRDVTRALLAAGARVNVQSDRSLYTALNMAAFGGHDHVLRLLLRAGARLDMQNKFGETAEQTARKPIVKALLAGVRRLGPDPPAAALARAVGRATQDKPDDHKRDDMALLGRYHGDRA